MNFSEFLNSWRGSRFENRFHRWVRVAEIAIIASLIGLLYAKNTIVTVTPPNLDVPVTITKNGADQGFKKAWGYFVADLMGNVTPSNVGFIQKSLVDILTSSVYHDIQENLAEQARQVSDEGISTEFEIQAVTYQQTSDLIFVSGKSITRGPFGDPDIKQRTYELKVEIRNYKPQISHLDAYEGGPRTRRDAQ